MLLYICKGARCRLELLYCCWICVHSASNCGACRCHMPATARSADPCSCLQQHKTKCDRLHLELERREAQSICESSGGLASTKVKTTPAANARAHLPLCACALFEHIYLTYNISRAATAVYAPAAALISRLPGHAWPKVFFQPVKGAVGTNKRFAS
jgi:hypothetical protein